VNKIIQSLTAPDLAESMDNNNVGFWTTYGDHPGGYYKNEPDIAWSVAGLNFPLYNCFLRYDLAEENFETELENFMDIIKAHKLPAYFWQASASKPAGVHERLEQSGWKQARQAPAMAMEISEVESMEPIPGFTVKPVQNDQQRRLWADILNRSVGMNDQDITETIKVELMISKKNNNLQHRYLGYLNDKPVATGLLHLESGLAGIYCIATLPEARRKGLGSFLTIKLIEDSSKLGYKVVALTSSEMGYRVYSKIGFKDIFSYTNYSLAP